ncbi:MULTISPECIES: DUF481 domain-containing protein [Olivibacter]|jgi:hypothetical protein|uniref:DUF481 domain-containing protein n=2 Tax=Sphingobacteriaceae TaxID=84566 RepID=F4CEA3_SPHS2|nr:MULTISPECIES: DUF481 domain-containing protein [Olivibacter]MCL4641467.1 DUF481 domain-containing protein [Olivibacter sp. UJ_SKK_5.1]MDM8176229.1 DUF481 domain-containing protein [Olivibacter sp. 47]MDX3915802.1 DUF481 domain-containing protein [Pseudosphingobacterium sp.]QEL00991.1 DUF481 domain-containing protein [Olivibacter sp. LS-1]
MVKQLWFSVLFVVFISLAHGQTQDSTNYYVQFSSTNSINKTNDKSAFLLNNALRFSIAKERIKLNFNNNWLYGRQDGSQSNNDFSSSLDFNIYRKDLRFFYWGLANYNTSFSLKIRNQLLAGAGVAYNLIDKNEVFLNISDGFLYDASSILENELPIDYQTVRNSFRLLYKFVFKELIIIQGSNFYQPSLTDAADFNIKLNNDIAFKLNKWLSLKGSLVYNRINRTDRENLLFTYGVAFEKYF